MPIWVWLSVGTAGAGAVVLIVGGAIVAVDAHRRAANRLDEGQHRSFLGWLFDSVCDLISQVFLGRWSDV